jgi:hypothetical protein
MSNNNSNLPPSYNSNNVVMNNMRRHELDFQSQILNKELLEFEKIIKKKYGKLTPSFMCNYHILNKIRILLEKKFNKIISKNDRKLLHNLQKKLDKFIELDIQHIFVLRQYQDTIKQIKKERQRVLTNYSISYLETLSKKKKKIAKDKFKEIKMELNYLHDLQKILKRKLNSIYEQFTVLLDSGVLLLNEYGSHFLDNTNFMDPTINLYQDDNNNNTLGIYNGILDRKQKLKNKTKKIYTAKPPSYKHSQKTTDIERKIFNKWKKIIKRSNNSNSYYTANNSNSYYTANNSNSTEKQKKQKKTGKQKKQKNR